MSGRRPIRLPRFAISPLVRAGAAAALASSVFSTGLQNAVANGDTRTISLFHAHTKESISATYLVNGRYDSEALKQLNWFLRDWRRDEPTSMDPRLFDIVWEVYRAAGAGGSPVTVMSAYRSPETNSMLRRRSRAVAKHSQHMLGKAMDTSMPGMSMEQIREVGMKMQRGGVGYYPRAGTPFVHLDVGSVRSWPRMSYDQLVRLFPDGKTVHLPANGQPLARYEEARAELEAGGNVYLPPSSKSKSFFAFLFGGGGEDDEDGVAPAPAQRGRSKIAALPSRAERRTQIAAYAPQSDQLHGDDGSRSFFANDGRAEAPVSRAERNLPRGETFMAPAPAQQPAPPAQTAAPAAPAAAPQPEKTQVAALVPAGALVRPQPADDDDEKPALADAPLPPRRPTELVALMSAPLPPARPAELTAMSYASSSAGLRRDPIGSIIGDSQRSRGSIENVAMAPLPPRRPETVPARLDRSNFRAMTGAQPAAQMTTQTVLGPAIVGARSAARAQAAAIASAPAALSNFGPKASDLSTSNFAGTQRGRAALTNAPPSRAN